MRWLALPGPLPPGLRRLLPALLALAASAELFAYGGYGAVNRRIAANALSLTERLRDENAPLRRWLHEVNAAPAAPDSADQDPDATIFLKQVDSAAARAGVQVTHLVPRPKQDALLDIELAASFPAFLRFAREAERLQGTFRGLQVRQPDSAAGATANRLAIGFTLEMPRRPARPAQRADAVPAAIAGALRDPFSTAAAAGASTDLSARHHLTGITRLGKAFMATIDGRDYQEGDQLGNMVVTAIRGGEVRLSAGSLRYYLRFAAEPG